jgi:hypothetical protein
MDLRLTVEEPVLPEPAEPEAMEEAEAVAVLPEAESPPPA